MKNALLLLLLLTLIAPIKAQTAVSKVESSLPGRWDWVKDIADYRGPPSASGVYGPEKCKCERHLIFKDGVVYEYQNDSLVTTSAYTLKEYHFMNDPVKVIFESKSLGGYIEINGDTIRIGWTGSCGTTHYYKRSRN